MFYTKKIISRTACLGNFTFDRLDLSEYRRINHCKNRIDYCLKINNNSKAKIDIDDATKFVVNDYHNFKNKNDSENGYVVDLMKAQAKDIFKYKNVKLFIMDTFSELTDKLFVCRENGRSFCTHYINVNHSPEFKEKYEYLDSIEESQLAAFYDQFFSKVVKSYGNIPIVLIYFPTIFDEREEYKNRDLKIHEAVESVKNKYPNLITIEMDFVERHPTDTAAYHFSEKTYEVLAEKIQALGILKVGNGKEVPFKRNKLLKFFSLFIPNKKLRKKIRNFEF